MIDIDHLLLLLSLKECYQWPAIGGLFETSLQMEWRRSRQVIDIDPAQALFSVQGWLGSGQPRLGSGRR